ncbi:MAG TPA: glutaredoxin family protein [Candidatus Binatia bacterium]|nr:glutaredoxin family protein [Candidatus Binatia bacterium]
MSTDDATTRPIRVTLYTRNDCHLCEEMHAVVDRVARDIPLTTEHVDVDTDPELAAEYGAEVPVLCVNGRKAFKYRVDERTLRARLAREPR